MKFLEKDLEDIIWDNIQNDESRWKLAYRGITPAKYLHRSYRQLSIGNYGVADIVTAYRDGGGGLYVTVWELKRLIIDVNALIQAARYVKGIESYLSKRISDSFYFEVDCVLIGSEVDKGDWVYLNSLLKKVRVFTYQYDIDGISFRENSLNYSLTNEGFHV